MIKLKIVAAALLSGLIGISTAQARGPYGSINVGNWKGGAFTNDQTGVFTPCVAGANYHRAIYFMVMVYQARGWSLGFQHPKWSFTATQAFPRALSLHCQAPFYGQG